MKPRTDPQPGIPAKYDDVCVRCGEPIARNDRIVFLRGRPIHCGCASGSSDE